MYVLRYGMYVLEYGMMYVRAKVSYGLHLHQLFHFELGLFGKLSFLGCSHCTEENHRTKDENYYFCFFSVISTQVKISVE
jgi:hypothetical protein